MPLSFAPPDQRVNETDTSSHVRLKEGLGGTLAGRDEKADMYLLGSMKRTKLVAVWVAHICQVHGTEFAFT